MPHPVVRESVNITSQNEVGDQFQFFLTQNGTLFIIRAARGAGDLETIAVGKETLTKLVNTCLWSFPAGTFDIPAEPAEEDTDG